MEFRLLGPLEVADHDRSVALGGIRQRSLLPVLMLHADEVVATDPLDADLWGDAPPPTATESIQIYVSRLRKALWRGQPLADLAYEPSFQTAIARLEDLRLAALEQRIDADATGRRSPSTRSSASRRTSPCHRIGSSRASRWSRR